MVNNSSHQLSKYLDTVERLLQHNQAGLLGFLNDLTIKSDVPNQLIFDLGKVLFHQKEYFLARYLLEQANSRQDQDTANRDSRWWNLLGLCASALGDHASAILAFEKSFSLEPKIPATLGNYQNSQVFESNRTGVPSNSLAVSSNTDSAIQPDWCYTPSDDAPLPTLRPYNKQIKIGYLGRNESISDEQVLIWLQALSANSHLNLSLAIDRFQSPYAQARLYKQAQDCHINPSRLRCLPYPKNKEQYWQFLSKLDVSLTSLQSCHPNQVLDSLYVGVPVILNENHHPSCGQLQEFFDMMQLNDWVAKRANTSMKSEMEILSTLGEDNFELRRTQYTTHHRLMSSLITHSHSEK